MLLHKPSRNAKLYLVRIPKIFARPWTVVTCYKHIKEVFVVKATARNLTDAEAEQHISNIRKEHPTRDLRWTGCEVCDDELAEDYVRFYPN